MSRAYSALRRADATIATHAQHDTISLAETGAGDAAVLVCLLNNTADLARARDEGWYRIPLARAPRLIAADYLAFYLSAAFGPERWTVRYIARVLRVTIARRHELIPAEPAHPRAQERYYRFVLGQLQPLPAALPSSRLRRITFIPTTLAQLEQAADVVDLWRRHDAAEQWGQLWGAGIGRRALR
jgi:hypothetical protein